MTKINKPTVKDLAITGVLAALVLAATMFTVIPLPFAVHTGGTMHLGNVALFISAIIFGRKKGAFAGAVGMSLFNLLTPLPLQKWALFTFIIRGVMGYSMGWIAEKGHGKSLKFNIIAILCGGAIQIVGYYIAGLVFYDPIVLLSGIPGDVVQIILSGIVVIPVLGRLCRYRERFI